jgi:Helix-turn-helix domain
MRLTAVKNDFDCAAAPLRYTSAKACKVAGISRKCLYSAINSGDLPAVKCYGRFWILASDLEAWRERLPQINAFDQPICRIRIKDGCVVERDDKCLVLGIGGNLTGVKL